MLNCCILGREIKKDYRIISKDNDFTLTPALGPIGIEGYSLLITNEHFDSMANMPNYLRDNFIDGAKYFANQISNIYSKNVVLFEHGPKFISSKAGSCIDHTHLHLVPTNMDLIGYFKNESYVIHSNFDNSIYEKTIQNKNSYFYIHQNLESFFIPTYNYLPSQFIRRLIGEYEQNPNWDWRTYPDYNTFNKTLKTLKNEINN